MTSHSILLCTIGTGDVADLEKTLLTPLRKSIHAGEWSKVILLPSTITSDNADRLRTELANTAIDVRPLPAAGLENDADACFGHFNTVIEELRSTGVAPQELLADFTRGTKAMSAALVLAAVRHGLPKLRYLSGQRDARGMVVGGTEQINDLHTTLATARQRLDLSVRLLFHGDFAAVQELFPDESLASWRQWPTDELRQVEFILPLARFYAAWDRLDYRAASEIALPEPPCAELARYHPAVDARRWVTDLASGPPDNASTRAGWLRLLVADLLANGERRLRDHQFEDAVIRAYRVLELVGQLRLCDQEIHSDHLPKDHPQVMAFQEELIHKNKSKPLEENRKGGYFASREQVARLLKRMGDPLAKTLLDLGNQGVISPAKRNYSPFIHGFVAQAGNDPKPLKELYAQLEDLLIRDGGQQVAARLRLARSMDLSRS